MIPVSEVGPRLSEEQFKVMQKVVDFTSQVWINCEHQVNMYLFPCGELFAEIATNLRKLLNSNVMRYPCSLFFTLGLQFGGYINHRDFGDTAAILAILFIKWAKSLEALSPHTIESQLFLHGFNSAFSHIENIKSSSHLLQSLKAGHCELSRNLSREIDMMKVLEAAASSAEDHGNKTFVNGKKVAESHVVGITLRAIFQAFKVSST